MKKWLINYTATKQYLYSKYLFISSIPLKISVVVCSSWYISFFLFPSFFLGLPSIMLFVEGAVGRFWGMCRDVHSSEFNLFFLTIAMFIYWKILIILWYDNQVLFKLVVITVLVIAESADNCIKTVMLTFSFSLFYMRFFHPIFFVYRCCVTAKFPVCSLV